MGNVSAFLSAKTFYVTAGVVILFLLIYVYFTGDPSTYGGLGKLLPTPCTIDHNGTEDASCTSTISHDPLAPAFKLNTLTFGSPKGYMFPLRIAEQLTMCTAHFHQFLNLVNDWGFTGVEPYAYGSTMFGSRSIHANNPSGSVPFNKMFNATIHNDYLSKCMKRQSDPETGNPILFEPVAKFLRHSHRKIVLVYFASHHHLSPVIKGDIQRKVDGEINRERGPFVECTTAVQTHGMAKVVEYLLDKEMEIERISAPLPKNLAGFKVSQAFCVKKDIKISLRDLRDFLLKNVHRENDVIDASVVFISWQGRFTHPLVDSDVSNYINKCRIPFSQPFHSDFVLNLAKRYLNSLNLHRQPYLSVHVRFEKLYYFAAVEGNRGSLSGFLNCCMNRLNAVLSVVTQKFNITSPSNVLLTWDYSPYGSQEFILAHSPEIARDQLKKVSATPVYFNPRDFDISAQQSIISLVDMDFLLNASALVTVGGGSYQHTITQMFIEQHSDPDVPEAAEKLHYGHLCIPKLETNLHGIELPRPC